MVQCPKMLVRLDGAHAFWVSIFGELSTFGRRLKGAERRC
jgi:hypothetical protein